jgi:hypothetical protein
LQKALTVFGSTQTGIFAPEYPKKSGTSNLAASCPTLVLRYFFRPILQKKPQKHVKERSNHLLFFLSITNNTPFNFHNLNFGWGVLH